MSEVVNGEFIHCVHSLLMNYFHLLETGWLGYVFTSSHKYECLTLVKMAGQDTPIYLCLLEEEVEILPTGLWEYNGVVVEGHLHFTCANCPMAHYL